MHAVQGRLSERPDAAAAIRAADREGPRSPDAVQPAVDQQVLHHGPRPGPELHRVGRPARPYGLCDQLQEPVRGHVPHDDGRLPGQRSADRSRRGRGDHRHRHDRHRRVVPRWCDDGDHRRVPDAGGRQPDRHPHPAQHDARLLPARCPRRLHRHEHGRAAREEDAARRGHSRARRWPARSTCCGPTT